MMEKRLLRVETDPKADAIYIELLDLGISHSEELDDNRIIDRSLDGRTVGVDLLAVSEGVKLEGLPEAELVKGILVGLGISVY